MVNDFSQEVVSRRHFSDKHNKQTKKDLDVSTTSIVSVRQLIKA